MLRLACCVCLAMATVTTGFHLPGPMRPKASREVKAEGLAKKVLPALTTFLGLALPYAPIQSPPPALADGATTRFSLPPIDKEDKSRCQFKSSNMGQANAARDKLYDLRLCDMSGQKAEGFDLSGALMGEAKFEKTSFRDAIMSKAYARSSNFEGADFTNAVVDRVSFEGSKLKGAVFANAVLSGTSFANADLTDVDFTDSYLGEFDLRALCRNPSLQGTNPVTGAPTKESAGCK